MAQKIEAKTHVIDSLYLTSLVRAPFMRGIGEDIINSLVHLLSVIYGIVGGIVSSLGHLLSVIYGIVGGILNLFVHFKRFSYKRQSKFIGPLASSNLWYCRRYSIIIEVF